MAAEGRASPPRAGLPGLRTFLAAILFGFVFVSCVSAATTSLHLVKVDAGNTVIAEKTVDYTWMEENLPVRGDGITHYYHQGPVFIDDPEARWNPAEDRNVQEKDMGALEGTSLPDLCDLVGGMEPGDTVRVTAVDGYSKTFDYRNVYAPSPRQGLMVITWFRDDEGYVPEYRTGMRLVFFADNTTNPWGINAFGNQDWRESADPEYYYYYVQGSERYPTTTGLSVQEVATITVIAGSSAGTTPSPTSAPAGILVSLGAVVLSCGLSWWRKGK
jgi:hypothetical protein